MPRNFLNVMNEIRNFELKEDDIWIVTFPKCGTTWVQETISGIINNMDKETMDIPLVLRSPYLEIECYQDLKERERNSIVPEIYKEKYSQYNGGTIQYSRNLRGRRFIKSHLPFDFLPAKLLGEKRKVVYVGRNPGDCAVSYYHHMMNMPGYGYRGGMSKFFHRFMSGLHLAGDFWKHLESGWIRRDHPNAKFIWFEDMKKDTRKVIGELATFLQHPLAPQTFEQLVNHVRFDVMKDNPAASAAALLKMEGDGKFLREGKVGGWKKNFTEEDINAYEGWVRQNMLQNPIVRQIQDEKKFEHIYVL